MIHDVMTMSSQELSAFEDVNRQIDSRARVRSRISSRCHSVTLKNRTSNLYKGPHSKPSDDLPVLSYQSLLTFAMFIKEETAESIALRLGVPFQIIQKIKDRFLSEVHEVREPTVLRTFHILWYWRGRHSNRHMVEEILNVLRDMCKWELASVIHNAHKERRRIKMSDFSHLKS